MRAGHPGVGPGAAVAAERAPGQGGGRREAGGDEPEVVTRARRLALGNHGTAAGAVVVRAFGVVFVIHREGVDIVQGRAGVQDGGGPRGIRPRVPRIQDVDFRGHVAEQIQQQEVPCPAPGLQRGVRIGREKHRQVPAAGEEVLEPGSEEGTRRVRGAVDGPVALRAEQQPFAVRAQIHVCGHVDLHPRAVAEHGGGLFEETDPVDRKRAFEPRRRIVGHDRHHVVLGDVEKPLGLRQGFPPAQLHAGPGVGRGGPRQVSGGRGDEQGVPVQPGGVALAGRQVEAAVGRVHEAAGLDVELAVAVRVAAVGGERQQRPPVRFARGRAEEVGSVEDPILAFGGGERVDIQEHVPRGRPGPVAVPAGPPPQALGVVPVLPKVVVPLAVLAHHGDPVGGVEDLQDPALELGVIGILEELLGAGVLFTDPGQLLLAVDVLQPDVLVDRFGGGARSRDGCRWLGRARTGDQLLWRSFFHPRTSVRQWQVTRQVMPAAGLPIRWMPWAYREASGRQ